MCDASPYVAYVESAFCLSMLIFVARQWKAAHRTSREFSPHVGTYSHLPIIWISFISYTIDHSRIQAAILSAEVPFFLRFKAYSKEAQYD